MATTPLGIVYPTLGDVMTPLATRFAALANSADSAITAAVTSGNQQFTGPGANIGSVTGMKLGDTYQATDGQKVLWRYDGSNWVTNDSGMLLVRPLGAAVSGVTVNTDGSFTVAGVTTAGLNSVFNARYSRFKLFMRGSVLPGLQLRSGATNDASSTYRGRRVYLSNASDINAGAYGPLSSIPLTAIQGDNNWVEVTIFDPASAVYTLFNGQSGAWAGGTNNSLTITDGLHGSAAAYDGLGFSSGSNMSFTGKLYAYA